MSETVADIVLQRLREWGVRQVFGYPGDGINGLLSAWVRAENDPQFVQSRHEEMSAFQAVGYAKFSGEVGVCAATSGPGGIHLLNGLYDAKLDHVPVVALVGQTERSAMGGAYQQEIDTSHHSRPSSRSRPASGSRRRLPRRTQTRSRVPPRFSTPGSGSRRWSARALEDARPSSSRLPTWEQRAMSGSPKFAASQELPDVDYAAFARGIGLVGINVDDPDGLGTAWDTALAADRPALLDVRCDPTVPPVPPHATREQVLALGEALVKGDDDAWAVAKNAARQGIRQFLPGRQSDND
nr:thiamine pyrophosphate-binding protein [Gordonia hongkongensis]